MKFDSQIYLIVGDENYQNQVLKELFSHFNVNPSNIEYYEPNNHDWENISLSLKTYSLFGTPKFFVVKNVNIFKQEEDVKTLLERCEEALFENDTTKAYRLFLDVLLSIEIGESEYEDLLSNPTLIKSYLSDYVENVDFLDNLLKQYKLPPKLPQKKAIDLELIISQIPSGHYLVLTSEKVDKRTKAYKVIEKKGHIFEKIEKKLTERESQIAKEKLIDEYLKTRNITISSENLYFLKEKALETQDIESALTKLNLLTINKNEITADDITEAFDNEYIPDSIKLSEYIKKKDRVNIFKIITNSRNTKTDYIKLCGLLRNLLKTAMKMKELAKGEKFTDFRDFERGFYQKNPELKKQHPYYLYNCWTTFERFSLEKLLEIYSQLFEIEVALKTTQKNPKDLFIDLFINLFS